MNHRNISLKTTLKFYSLRISLFTLWCCASLYLWTRHVELHLGTRFSGGLRSIRLMVGLTDLNGLSNLSHSVILN